MSKIVEPSEAYKRLDEKLKAEYEQLIDFPDKPTPRPSRNPKIKALRLLGYHEEADREQTIWDAEKEQNREDRKAYTVERDRVSQVRSEFIKHQEYLRVEQLNSDGQTFCEACHPSLRAIVEKQKPDELYVADCGYYCEHRNITAHICEECIERRFSYTHPHSRSE